MHQNLERRFIELATAQSQLDLAFTAFSDRYGALFDAMVVEMGTDRATMAKMVGFDPMPMGGNAVMNGLAKPSTQDCYCLLNWYMSLPKKVKDG